MFAGGLNQTLTSALSDLAEYIPDLGPEIRGRLLDLLSMTLAQKPYNYPDTPSRSRKRAPVQPQQGPNILPKEEQDKLIALALNILGSFNFQGFMLSELLRDTVVNYLTETNPYVQHILR
jgi:FKBP12-rapamycin complex-associated protein